MAKKKVAVSAAEAKPPVKKRKSKRADNTPLDMESLKGLSAKSVGLVTEEISMETGDLTMATLERHGDFVVGIPCPAFAFEYLIGTTAIPLEKFIQIYGPTGIGKSGLAFEMYRWIRSMGGVGAYLEHESKFNHTWAKSIVGWDDPQDFAALGILPCRSIDHWQEMLQDWILKQKHAYMGPPTRANKADPDKPDWEPDKPRTGFPGKIYPAIGIVDSLLGKATQETMNKIAKEGHAGRAHPIEALSITGFFRLLPELLRQWPMWVVTINHMKENKGEDGKPKKTRPGGQGINYYGSYEFEVKRTGRIRKVNVQGNQLVIRCAKNSYGIDDRRLSVDVLWSQRPVMDAKTGDAVYRQCTVWDWNGATVRMIVDGKGEQYNQARKITGLSKKNNSEAKSTLLGESGKTYSNSELGALLQQNKDMLEQLRRLFGIEEMNTYVPGLSYDRQLFNRKELIGDG